MIKKRLLVFHYKSLCKQTKGYDNYYLRLLAFFNHITKLKNDIRMKNDNYHNKINLKKILD